MRRYNKHTEESFLYQEYSEDNLEFNIVIMEDVGYIRQVAEFTATRWVDEDKTPFLKN